MNPRACGSRPDTRRARDRRRRTRRASPRGSSASTGCASRARRRCHSQRIVAGLRCVLGVALVARHDDPALARPRRDLGEVRVRPTTTWGCRARSPRAAARVRRRLRDRRRGRGASRRRADRHRAAAGEHRTHLVARVRDRGIQHGVALRVPQPQQVRQPGDELLRADARTDCRASTTTSKRRAIHAAAASQRRAARRRRTSPSSSPRPRRRLHRDVGHRIARRADRAVDDAAGRLSASRSSAQPVVRVRRRDEAHERIGNHRRPETKRSNRHREVEGPEAYPPNSAKWPVSRSGRRARTRVPCSSCTSTNTSPARCNAASTSARS